MSIDFDILQTAVYIGLNIRPGTENRIEVEARCPFCRDTKYHLGLNRIKNVFRCNGCKESGGVLHLYAKVFGVSTREAYAVLKNELPRTFCYADVKPVNPANININAIKPVEQRDAIYRKLLSYLTLSDMHFYNLKKRGLSVRAMGKNLYRSIPLIPDIRKNIIKKLSDEFELAGIPGFYQDENGCWDMYCKSGILIPVKDLEGRIQGLQLRLDDTASRKYRWFSSNYFRNGTKTEPWVHVTGNTKNDSAYITEGPLKADVASSLAGNRLFIAVPGINCTDKLPEVLKSMGIERVAEAFDMDRLYKPEVKKAVEVIKDLILSSGIEYVPFYWDSRYKGIDDFLNHRRANVV
jgi:DNA primase